MTNEQYNKPLPRPLNALLSKPFWEAAQRGELLLPRCKQCGKVFWYPRQECPNCLSNNLDWQKVTGRGHLYTYTVVRQPQDPAFNDMVPYAYAIVQLDEGVKMISNIVDCAIEDLRVDMPVEAVFDKVTEDWTLVRFRPASS